PDAAACRAPECAPGRETPRDGAAASARPAAGRVRPAEKARGSLVTLAGGVDHLDAFGDVEGEEGIVDLDVGFHVGKAEAGLLTQAVLEMHLLQRVAVEAQGE